MDKDITYVKELLEKGDLLKAFPVMKQFYNNIRLRPGLTSTLWKGKN